VRPRRRGETADRLPPEPAAGGGGRCLTARLEFFFQIAEDEVAPPFGQAPRQQQDGDARRLVPHFVSSRRSRPTAIAVNAR
jgi:hypothetical protein